MPESTDPFADIRPYTDAEVPAVLGRLAADTALQRIVLQLRFGEERRFLRRLLQPVAGLLLRWQLRKVNDVRGFQLLVKKYLDHMIDQRTSGVSVTGLDALDANTPWLFFSNHRDIVLDPALVNHSLYHNGHDTVRIAIGDNLLKRPFAADLMRINKSFIVPRSARGPRQMLAAFQHLSAYIRHCVTADRVPLWLAHREGRAKDGLDVTEPAIIKMLGMSRDKKSESLADSLLALNIVPVAISYEWDPCDVLKAAELLSRAEGAYVKTESEDLESIALGINGFKGRVHIHFCEPLLHLPEEPKAIAAQVDKAIQGGYVLQASNILAWSQLEPDQALPDSMTFAWPARHWREAKASSEAFNQRLQEQPPAIQQQMLKMYANPVYRKLAVKSS